MHRGRGRRRRARAIALGCGLAAALACAPAAHGSHLPHKPSGVQDLLTEANVEIFGPTAQTESEEVASAGDVNDDGRDDLIVGAEPGPGSPDGPGAAYVVFGRATEGIVNLAALGSAGFKIAGAGATENLGHSVAGVGDQNADGKDDVLVAAPGTLSAYVIFGKASTTTVSVGSLGAGGYRIMAADDPTNDPEIDEVAAIGDVNDDGTPDLGLGAPAYDSSPTLGENSGAVFVLYGKTNPADVSTVSLDAIGTPAAPGYRLTGVNAGSILGRSVAGGIDVNGDDIDDLVAGAPSQQATPAGDAFNEGGIAYVVFGGGVMPPATLIDQVPGFQIVSLVSRNLGYDAAGVGDMNGDGKDEVILGTDQYTGNDAFVIFGKDSTARVDVDQLGSGGFKITGGSGNNVAGAGDLNGDGTPDLLVDSFQASPNGRSLSGSLYAVYGRNASSPVSLASIGTGGNTQGFRIDGKQALDRFGNGVTGMGDFNGDGAPDLAGAGPRATRTGTYSGVFNVSYGFEVDPPTAQITSGPDDPTNSTGATFTFSASDANTAPGNVLLIECNLDAGGWVPCDSNTTTSYAGLDEGTHTFRMRATDSFHNVGAPATYTWTIDLTPPVVEITNPASDGTSTADTTPTFEFATELGATLECSVDQGSASFGPCDSDTAHTPASLPDGNYTFRVRATDLAGNLGAVSTRTITIDSSVPTLAITSPTEDGTATRDNTPEFQFTAEAGSAVQCSIDQGTPAFGDCDSTTAHTPEPLADGTWIFRVQATDTGGTATATRTIIVDTVAPALTITNPAADGTTGNDRTPTFEFTAEPGTAVECSLDQGTESFGPCNGPAGTHTPGADQPDGDYTFRVRATDAAGNETTRTRTVAIDATPPALAITVPAADGTTTTDLTPTFEFTVEPGAGVECSLDQGTESFGPCNGPAGTHTPGSDLAPGDYTFRVRATDGAGNTATQIRSITVATPAQGGSSPTTSAPAADCTRTMTGTREHDALAGSEGSELIRGLLGDDQIDGLDGNDCLFGNKGHDRLDGGPGDDTLSAGNGRDRVVGGTGADAIRTGTGPDRIQARDAERDRISCGGAFDVAIVDSQDSVRGDCERVRAA